MRPLAKVVLVIVVIRCAARAQSTSTDPAAAKSGDQMKALLAESFTRNTFAYLQGPYHLLATFHTFDENGQPAGDGSNEKYFLSPGNLKIVTKFNGRTSTTYYADSKPRYTDDGFTGSILTYFVREFLLNPLVPPFGLAKRNTTTSVMTLLGATLDCAGFQLEMYAQHSPQPPPDSYCVSRDTGDLVMHQSSGFSARYRDFASFQGRSIARTIVVSKGPRTRIRIKIETVDEAVLPESERTAPPDASPMDPGPEIRSYSADELEHGGALKPSTADVKHASHAQGMAILYVLISREGKAIDVEPRYLSDPSLENIAADIAKSGSYKPLTRQGVPVENIMTQFISIP